MPKVQIPYLLLLHPLLLVHARCQRLGRLDVPIQDLGEQRGSLGLRRAHPHCQGLAQGVGERGGLLALNVTREILNEV